MHRYECGNCQLVSDPYVLRNAAERYGQEHRDKRHDGMHPMNEAILSGGGRMPQAGEWRIFVLFGVLILLGIASKVL
ncbi:hypothetical protein [Streptomyces sp. NPDC018693]|uniref:hypothetical protein n=1 Tax=unclassified Streptomyces TaxID=2593676 RepID=UPI00378F222E